MPCPKMEAGKTCEDCDEIADKPNGYKECDKRISDWNERKLDDAKYLQLQKESTIGIQK